VDTKLGGEVDIEEVDEKFYDDLQYRYNIIVDDWGRYEVREALRKTNELVNWGNKYINDSKPWSESDPKKVKQILTNCFSLLWTAFYLYTPVFPHRLPDFDKAIEEKKKMILFSRI
jgi:methionyl-tRNA synthetase